MRVSDPYLDAKLFGVCGDSGSSGDDSLLSSSSDPSTAFPLTFREDGDVAAADEMIEVGTAGSGVFFVFFARLIRSSNIDKSFSLKLPIILYTLSPVKKYACTTQLRAALRTELSRSDMCLATSFRAMVGVGWHTLMPSFSIMAPMVSRHSVRWRAFFDLRPSMM